MMHVIQGKIPIKLWTDELEETALEQLKFMAELPFAFKHVAAMADCHTGFGMPIGGVLACENVIIPNAIGSDIGCSVSATRLPITEISYDLRKEIYSRIKQEIPMGAGGQYDVPLVSGGWGRNEGTPPIAIENHLQALKQLGTLGGGNHFIEIQKGSDLHIWVMIHTGSRRLGHAINKHYNALAQQLNRAWHSNVPEKANLAFLPLSSEPGQLYFREMKYAVDYARENHKLIMGKVLHIIGEVYGKKDSDWPFLPEIHVCHNEARVESHFGKTVVVHRKGAIPAQNGTVGLIPGSQGTKSYVVKGKGNKQAFNSCSHGAGRRMSRSLAKTKLDFNTEKTRMGEIVHGMNSKDQLDEAPGSYKDIEQVMVNQMDLVEVCVALTPIISVKG